MIKFEMLPPDTLSKIPAAVRVLEEDAGVVFAYLFGGLASGIPKPLSDLDLAVYTRDVENLAEYKLGLFQRLADTLEPRNWTSWC
jgi:predicted nucleotidyltransferase